LRFRARPAPDRFVRDIVREDAVGNQRDQPTIRIVDPGDLVDEPWVPAGSIGVEVPREQPPEARRVHRGHLRTAAQTEMR
jgi:hypothetical protein